MLVKLITCFNNEYVVVWLPGFIKPQHHVHTYMVANIHSSTSGL